MADFSAIIDNPVILGELTQGLNLLTTLAIGESVMIVDSQTLLPVFYGAQIMKVNVRETSKVMSHPLETGVTISDHHVILPKEIDVSLIIPSFYYLSVYQQIKTAFNNAELLIMQTNASVYPNLIVADMPHEESPDMFGMLTMSLRLKEILFVAPASVTTQNTPNPTTVPSNYAPADPVNSNTVDRGLCTAADPTGNGVTQPSINFWDGGAV